MVENPKPLPPPFISRLRCYCHLAWRKPKTSAMAKELDTVHAEFEEREVQMAALTRALSEAGMGLR